jgi:protein-L-isoaspartate(D-aspartate) O-methyltransferase
LWAYVLDHMDLAPDQRVAAPGLRYRLLSAVMAELVGAGGQVTPVEHDGDLARRAAEALAAWPRVRALHGDGSRFDGGAQDAIVVSAGATHPLPSWLVALRPGGRLVFPLTSERLGGYMLKVRRGESPAQLGAEMLCRARFIPFVGGRNAALDERLATQIAAGHADLVRSLRRDRHVPDGSCWLHGEGFCLSWRGTD